VNKKPKREQFISVSDLQSALDSIGVPGHFSPSKSEQYKAMGRHIINELNKHLKATPTSKADTEKGKL
jgi:hypothetical protein